MKIGRAVKRSSLAVLLVIFITYVAILARYSRRFDGNFSGFACIGSHFPAPGIITEKTFVLENSPGYDGQFFFFASHDPFIRKGLGEFMDVPAYRYQRIMYPWLAALFALGRPELIPYSLVLVNVGSILIGSFFVIWMLKKQGMSPWYALFYGFFSGFILCVFRDLAGAVAMGFMVGGIYFYSLRRFYLSALFLSCSVLSKELVLIVVFCLLLHSAAFRRSGRAFLAMLVSVLPFLIWQGYVFLCFRVLPYQGGKSNFGKPLVAIVAYVQNILLSSERWGKNYVIITLVVIFLSMLLASREIWRSRDEVSIPFLVFSMLPVFMTDKIWVEPWSFGRVLLPVGVFLLLNFIYSKDGLYLVPLAGHVLLSFAIMKWLAIL